MSDNDVLSGAAKSAVYTVVIQGLFRVLTFVMNSVMLHYVTRDLLGVANVRLVLLNQTVVFLTCEAFRRACLSKVQDKCWIQIINMLWLIMPVGVVWTVVCGFLWLYVWQQPNPAVVPFYETSVYWFCLSSLIEVLAQPLAIVAQILLFVELKAVVEGVSLMLRCFLTTFFVVWCPQFGLRSFCYAQMLYAGVMFTLYWTYFVFTARRAQTSQFPFHRVRDFFPRTSPGKSFVCGDTASLVTSFFLQSCLKYFLTEGEKIVMTVLGILSFADQGVYEVISNLGSLPARMLFLPIEDSLYLFFTKTLTRGVVATRQDKESVQLAGGVLQTFLKLSVLIGLVFIVYGFAYCSLLLRLYGGSTLTDGSGPMLLRWYCAYVLLNAVNGVTEGFKNATMTDSQVNAFSRVMVVLTVVTISSSWVFTLYAGGVGLIWANCINMSLRIAHSVRYMVEFFADSDHRPHHALLPHSAVMSMFIVAACLTALSEQWVYNSSAVAHVSVGVVCLLSTALVVCYCERHLVTSLRTDIWPLLQRRPHHKSRTL